MSKMIAGLLFMYLVITLLVSFMNGGGGIETTVLTAPMTASDVTATVNSTAGFLPNGDRITIGGEDMVYTSIDYTHFKGLVRTPSTAVAHSATYSNGNPTMVYNQQTSLINNALGFNANAVSTSSGIVTIATIALKFFTTTLPNVISGSSILPLLPAQLQFLGYFWVAMTAGMGISLIASFVWMLSGIVGKLTG
jgi:hypothetical protein